MSKDNQEKQEYEIPDKSFILAKATSISMGIVFVTTVIIFIIVNIIK